MEPTPVAAVFLRHEGDVLLRSSLGGWQVPASRAGERPREMATSAIETRTPLDPTRAEPVRRGDSFRVTDPSGSGTTDLLVGDRPSTTASVDGPVRVHPFLYECERRPTATGDGYGWEPPTVLLDGGPQAHGWEAYDRIRPTVGSVETDTDHGSTTLSVRALEVLRDESALLAASDGPFQAVEAVTRQLAGARPTMTAVANRVRRAVVTARDRTPAAVSAAAREGISRAVAADGESASLAAERIENERVATLSRSGTVLDALERGEPSAVLVARSRPGGEGLGVAREVSAFADVTLTSDAAFPGQLGKWDADTLLVGADSVLADGRVVNKVGTFGAALAAAHHGIEVVVVAASDKIDPGRSYDPEPGDGEIARESEVDVNNPTFEAVPPSCVDAFVTERGVLGTSGVREIADDHAALRSRLRPDERT